MMKSNKTRFSLVGFIFCSLLLSNPSWGQDGANSTLDALRHDSSPAAVTKSAIPVSVTKTAATESTVAGEEVVVRGRAANLLGLADSAMQGSVSQEDLSHRALLRTGEVMEAVPGLLITQHSGDGKANQYFSRGFNLDHGTDFSFNADDVPINLPSNAHGQGYTDLNFLIPDLVKEVNYSKGLNSVEYGEFNTAGSANFVYPNTLPQNIASLTMGEWGYQRGLLAASNPLGSGNLLYAVEVCGYDGPWDVPEDNKKYNGLLRYSYGNSESRWAITASLYQAAWTSTDQVPQRAVDEGLIDFWGSLDPTDGGKTKRYSVWASWNGQSQDCQSMVMAYETYFHMNLWSNFTYFTDDPVHGDQFEQEDERYITGAKARQIYNNTIAGLAMKNEIGADFRNDDVPILGLYDTEAHIPWQTVQLNQMVQTSGAPYAENTTYWTPWLRSILGYRHDFFHFKVNGATPATSGEADANIAEPKVALVLRPYEGPVELYANYGWGFHSNDARIIAPDALNQLSIMGNNVNTAPLVHAEGEEVGARFGWQNLFESTVSLWRLHLDSELTFDGDAAAPSPNGPSTRNGVEWSNSLRPKPFFLDFDYSWCQARFDQTALDDDGEHPGEYVPEAPVNMATATLGTDPIEGWSADCRLRYFGARPLVPDNSVQSSDLTLVSLRVSRQLTENQSIFFDIFNLFNQRGYDISYYYATSVQSGAPSIPDINSKPAEPRSLRVTWQDRF